MDTCNVVQIDCDFVGNLKSKFIDKIDILSLYWRLPSQDLTEWTLHIARFSNSRAYYIGGVIVNGVNVSWNVPLPQPNDKQVAIYVSNNNETYETSYDDMYKRINEIVEHLMR